MARVRLAWAGSLLLMVAVTSGCGGDEAAPGAVARRGRDSDPTLPTPTCDPTQPTLRARSDTAPTSTERHGIVRHATRRAPRRAGGC